jgi:hypothetical protein
MKQIAEMKNSGGAMNTEKMQKLQQQLSDAKAKKEAIESGNTASKSDNASSSADSGRSKSSSKSSSSRKSSRKSSSKSSSKKSSSSKSGSKSKSGSSHTASADATPPAPAATKSKKKSASILDDLLSGGSAKKKKKSKPKSSKSSSNGPSGDKLSRAQVIAGMNKVKGSVRRCGQGKTGTVKIKAAISPSGSVTSAIATGTFAGTATGACAARAVRRAKFPRSSKSTTVTYPFKL